MTLDFDHKTPIYLQVAQMIRDAVLTGDLPEGEPIPSVRQVSVEHGLNPQTVLNAHRILMEEGILEKRRGLGFFVKEGAREALIGTELERFKSEDIPELANRARLLGLSQRSTLDLVRANFKE
ncbi:MAG: GntR family transcriptional regulator [Fidelibacterota bacterium]|nr:MAG: GntR family transcriptional regulator [Candidatus Neomarinimicrobiota bacterium]